MPTTPYEFEEPPIEEEGEEDESIDVDVGGLDAKWRVDEAKYEAFVIQSKKETSNAGKPMVTITWQLTGRVLHKGKLMDAPVDGEFGDPAGKEFKIWCSLAPQALFKLNEVAQAIGLPVVEGRIRCKLSDMLDRQAILEMKTEEYKGKPTSSAKTALPHPEGWER